MKPTCVVCGKPNPVLSPNRKHCSVACYLIQKQRLQNERRRESRARDREKGLATA